MLEVRSLLSSLSVALVTDNPHLGAPSKMGPTPAVFRITRDGDLSKSLVAPIHFGGTAQRGVDYNAWENSAVFQAGSSTAYVTAMPLNDSIADGNRTVTVSLDPVAGYTLGPAASATIQDYYVSGCRGVWKALPSPSWGNGLFYLDATVANGNLNILLGVGARMYFDLYRIQSTPAFTINIALDTDQNQATGDARCGTMAGADYVITGHPDVAVFGASLGYYQLCKLPTTPGVEQLQLIQSGSWTVPDGYAAGISIPLSAIGSPKAVDVVATLTTPIVAAQGNGDRCPAFGSFDTSTGKVVVRQPGVTAITRLVDPAGDGTGTFDLLETDFTTVADQVFTDLRFAQVVDPLSRSMPGPLSGGITFDSDRSVATGSRAFLTNGIPTWGGDTTLYFDIESSILGSSVTLKSFFNSLDSHANEMVIGTENTDYRWSVSGKTLSLATSLSMLDAYAREAVSSNFVLDSDFITRRVPTDGRMDAQVYVNNSSGYPTELAPNLPAAVDTSTGLVIQPLSWDNGKMVSASDNPYDINSPGFIHTAEWTGVDAEVVGSSLVVRGWLEHFLPTDLYNVFYVWIDTDMNAATGVGLTAGSAAQGIGADYLAETFISCGYACQVASLQLESIAGRLVTSLDAGVQIVPNSNPNGLGSWTVNIPLNLLGTLGPQLRLYLTSGYAGQGGATQVIDIAPNAPLVLNLNKPPVLTAIADRTTTAGQAITVLLSATDPENDPLSFSACVGSLAYVLQQQYGFHTVKGYWTNAGGRGEKWFLDRNNRWYFILPDGSLYQAAKMGTASGTLIEKLGTSIASDPTLLFNSVAGSNPAAVSVSGTTLKVTPQAGYKGTFYMMVTVNDGRNGTCVRRFKVTVS
jgi:hypothetical protein